MNKKCVCLRGSRDEGGEGEGSVRERRGESEVTKDDNEVCCVCVDGKGLGQGDDECDFLQAAVPQCDHRMGGSLYESNYN